MSTSLETPKPSPVEGLFIPVQTEEAQRKGSKVAIVGTGAVGLAAAYSIMNQGLCSELVLIDVPQVQEKLRGEAMDLQHASGYAKHTRIRYGSDYALTRDTDLVIVTAGARQNPGESRLDLIGRNLKIFQAIIPPLCAFSPNSCIMIVSNPVDILTFIAARLSGFPPGRVFGSGTSLDSSRFRTLVADRLGVDTRSVHAVVLGEHGDSSVPVFSQLMIGGQLLRAIKPRAGLSDDPDNWQEIHKQVVAAAGEIIRAKGYTNWAIGMTVASLTDAVLRNEHRVAPLSVPVRGLYGITQEVYLSLPAVLGRSGVRDIVPVLLDAAEEARLRASAAAIHEVQAALALPGGGRGGQ